VGSSLLVQRRCGIRVDEASADDRRGDAATQRPAMKRRVLRSTPQRGAIDRDGQIGRSVTTVVTTVEVLGT
jgi:hypothetical protein